MDTISAALRAACSVAIRSVAIVNTDVWSDLAALSAALITTRTSTNKTANCYTIPAASIPFHFPALCVTVSAAFVSAFTSVNNTAKCCAFSAAIVPSQHPAICVTVGTAYCKAESQRTEGRVDSTSKQCRSPDVH